MKRKHPEDDLAIAVASFLRVAAPELLWWHTPNGGNRGLNEAKRFKAMGVRAGVPDLCFILPTGCQECGTAQAGFIELKVGKKKQSVAQIDFENRVCHEELNCQYAVCHSVGEVQAVLEGWGVKLRGRVTVYKELVK